MGISELAPRVGQHRDPVFDYVPQLLKSNGDEKFPISKESDLLNFLIENRYDILYCNYALNRILGDDNYCNSRSMDVYIAKSRKYLAAAESWWMCTGRGLSYWLSV